MEKALWIVGTLEGIPVLVPLLSKLGLRGGCCDPRTTGLTGGEAPHRREPDPGAAGQRGGG